MALLELRQLCGLQIGEQPANQLRLWRVKRDKSDIEVFEQVLSTTCDPFGTRSSQELLNLASGRSANKETGDYILNTVKRGLDLRAKFELECKEDSSRFLKTVSRTKVMNFAAANSRHITDTQ